MSKMILEEGLFESQQMNEAFSPSMPKWLEDRLMFNKLTGFGGRKGAKRNNMVAKGRNVGTSREGGSQTYPYYSSRGSDTSLYYRVVGILNLDKANFISGPVPTSGRDERVKEPNIPIFHIVIPDGEKVANAWGPVDAVYIKGINDDEKLGNSETLFKYMSFKQLIEASQDFCYLDASDPNTYSSDVKGDRANMRRELSKIPNYDRYKSKPGYYSKLDKSGYVIDPDKYRRKLAELGRQDIQGTMDKMYSRLMRLKNEFATSLMNFDIKDKGAYGEFEDMFGNSYRTKQLMEKLRNAIRFFNSISQDINDALAESDEKVKNNELDYIFGSSNRTGRIKNFDDTLKELEKECSQIIRAEVDWDTDDYTD